MASNPMIFCLLPEQADMLVRAVRFRRDQMSVSSKGTEAHRAQVYAHDALFRTVFDQHFNQRRRGKNPFGDAIWWEDEQDGPTGSGERPPVNLRPVTPE